MGVAFPIHSHDTGHYGPSLPYTITDPVMSSVSRAQTPWFYFMFSSEGQVHVSLTYLCVSAWDYITARQLALDNMKTSEGLLRMN